MGASSLEQIINYSNGSNFTFDSGLIEFVAGAAQLKLQEDQETFAQDFASDAGFTYDSALAEFSGGLVRQIDKTPANSVMSADLTAKDLNWRKDGGSLTGTLIGVPSFSGTGMACTGSQGTQWTRTSLSQETLLVKYQPNYDGSPPDNVNIISTCGSNNDRVQLTHSPSGDNFRITVWDNTGNQLVLAATIGASGINLQSDTVYHLAIVLDADTDTVRLYRKTGAGAWVLHGTTTGGALTGWTRGGISKSYIVGADAALYNRAEGEFSDFSHYSAILTPTSSAPQDPLPSTIYAESKIDLPVFTFSGVGSIVSVDSATVTEANAPRYIVAGRYWNGSSWVVSNGTFAQASTSADVIANLTSFPATGATLVPVSVVFGDSNLQQSVDDFSVTVTGTTAYPLTNPAVINNSGVTADALESFVETTATVAGSDDIRYVINVNGQDKYWTGSAWDDSDGTYAQANTPDVIQTNASSLDLSSGGTLKIKAFLHSDDGLTTPALETVTVGYNFFNTQNDPATCTVWGFYRDVRGIGVEGAIVTFALKRSTNQYREAGDSIIEKAIPVTTDANGRFEIDLIRSSEFEASGGVYVLTIVKASDSLNTSIKEGTVEIEFTVPDATDVNITDRILEIA